MKSQVICGNNIAVLQQFPDNHFDSIVTDPPYGIDFLGKEWDATVGSLATYQECLRVLKPGGHILAFSAARTYHHLALAIEQAGFEIRDQIMWIYSSGFPKSQDIGRSIQRSLGVKETRKNPNARSKAGDSLYESGHQKEVAGDTVVCTDPEAVKWSGWGTNLKPAHEPIVMARKPVKGSIAANCQQWGVGALNIDATRVPYDDPAEAEADAKWRAKWSKHNVAGPVFQGTDINEVRIKQNKPSAGARTATFGQGPAHGGTAIAGGESEEAWEANATGRFPANVIGELGEYQKYFYCPKVSSKERHIGFDNPTVIGSTHPEDVRKHPLWEPEIGTNPARLKQKIIDSGQYQGNNHPTVKPIELMKYLIKLITPAGGLVLDPFNGSGSTGCAAVELGYEYVGIELDPKYVDIAERRIKAWYQATHSNQFSDLFEID